MAKRFPLDAVLRLRKMEAEIKMKEFASFDRVYLREKNNLNNFRESLYRARVEMDEKSATGGFSSQEAQLYLSYFAAQSSRIRYQVELVEKVRIAVEGKRKEMAFAISRRKIFDNLKDKHIEAEARKERKLEADQIDEIAGIRFSARGKRSSSVGKERFASQWKISMPVLGLLIWLAVGAGPAVAGQAVPEGAKAPSSQNVPLLPGEIGRVKGRDVPKKASLTDQLLQELEAKRRNLSRRESEIRQEETRLNELRADIKKRIVSLQELEKRVQGVLDKVETASDERLNHLVKAYSAMGADEAASLMNAMDISLAVRILRNMKVKKAGTILAVVQPNRAAQISEMLVQMKRKVKKK